MRSYLLVFAAVAAVSVARADSPLTSTPFAETYRHVKTVEQEMDALSHELSVSECDFLSATDQPLDYKMAFINALGWGDTSFTTVYTGYLVKKYGWKQDVMDSILTWRGGQPAEYTPAGAMTADEFACLAYLQAMGDYFRPLKAYYCAYHAVDLKPESGAAAYIFGLVMAQFYLDNQNQWCQISQVMDNIRNYEGYTVDLLRPDAIQHIFDYIDIYAEACLEKKETRPREDPGAYHKPERPQLMEDKKNYVDLEVVSIEAPEFVSEINGSRIVVKVRNKGTISSIETNARLKDLDITAAEARKKKFGKMWVQAIAENNGRATGEEGEYVKKGVDYDRDWELMLKVPVLQPGEEKDLIFELWDYWIYDSNCEMEFELDFDQNIQEKNEDNNIRYFVAWG